MREQADQKRDSFWFVVLFFVSETSSYDTKTLRGMRTRTKKKYVASDRARRENVPRHILFHVWNPDRNGGNDEKAWENTSPS